MELGKLKAFFAADELEWKPITISKKTNKGLAAAYVTNRAIMDRLDDVCGPEKWRNEYREGPDGGVLCGISIRVGDEWITKWDGAENTDIEPVKGGLSSSMRRAAVQWGIGRYLYELPQQWVPVDERGRFIQTPRVEPKYLPGRRGDKARADAPEPVHTVTPSPAGGDGQDAGPVTMGALMGLFGTCGFESSGPYAAQHRERRLNFAALVLDADVPTFEGLTAEQRDRIYKALNYFRSKGIGVVDLAGYVLATGLPLGTNRDLQRALLDYQQAVADTANE